MSGEQVDLEEFVRETSQARDRLADGDPASAAAILHCALARWRGPAFADISSPAIQQAAIGLAETRLGALEDRIEADLAAGGDPGLVPELRELVQGHPLRERFHGQLMRAPASAGRIADALGIFRNLRARLVEELGVEPSPQLQQLYRALLAGANNGVVAVHSPPYVVPQQLPSNVPLLVGRTELLNSAARLLSEKDSSGAPPCLAVTGPGGIGKTAFAVSLAHRLRDVFTDGQLYAQLGDKKNDRHSSETVLSHFLHGLGVPSGGVPADLDERSGLFRELLASRRLLIVLDDVADEEQLRVLLPAEPRCAVLVTSRRRLSGVEQIRALPLDVLDRTSGMDLLRAIAGSGRIDAEPRAAAEVVRLCGGLPLALRICAGQLASRTNWTIADLARRLAAYRDRFNWLDWLQLGDLDVRAGLTEGYAALDSELQRLFRRLGLLGISEFPAWVPAALLDIGSAAGERLLDRLVELHLVEPAGRGVTGPRFRIHDLIFLFTTELVTGEHPEVRRAGTRRSHGHWPSA